MTILVVARIELGPFTFGGPLRLDLKQLKKAETSAERVSPMPTQPFRALVGEPRQQREAALVQRARLIAATGAVPTVVELEAMLGDNDLVDDNFFERGMLAGQSICRLIFSRDGRRSSATGFLVSPHLLITNHHVFATTEQATGAWAEFNVRFDIRG